MEHCLFQAQGDKMDQASNPVICQVDGFSFALAAAENFDWLKKYGTVFQVMDQQSSGNLCFGLQGPYGKLFVKYAGAHTLQSHVPPGEAVAALKNAMALYENRHPALTELLAHGPVANGYAAVFAWQEGIPLRGPKGQRNKSVLNTLSLWQILSMLDAVYDLHGLLAEKGYVAVDFYDGNLLVDAAAGRMVVCDVDLYRKKPAVNDRGRMYGSSRFMAPEEFQWGASITEATTVFNLAALAFEIFGDNMDRRQKAWQGPALLFEVAARATEEDPLRRYPTVRAFLSAWREAVRRMQG